MRRLRSGGLFGLAALATLLSAGCNSTKVSNTPRTATEQLLISNAVDQSLNKINFAPLQGSAVYLEEKYLDSVDKGYLIGSMRHRISRAGAHLVAKPDDADIVLEVRSGGIGTDMSNAYVGIPEITLPGMLSMPEVKFISRDAQKGVAKIGLVAYDAKTMRVLGEGGVSMAESNERNWFVMGVGPFQDGSVRAEKSKALPRQPGDPYMELPAVVALAAPLPTLQEPEPGRVKYTAGNPRSTPVDQIDHAEDIFGTPIPAGAGH